MTIIVNARELLEQGLDHWDDYCNNHGLNPWGMSEGLIDPNEEFKLTKEEAIKYGFVKKDESYSY